MRRATITLPDELDERVESYLADQSPTPSLTSLLQEALDQYLRDYEWKIRGYAPAKRPLQITVAPVGSGHTDTSIRHDEVLAEMHDEDTG